MDHRNHDNKAKKEKSWTRKAIGLSNRSIGILFFYFIFFRVLIGAVLKPIGDKLLNLAMSSLPGHYISLDNARLLLTHPLIILILLLEGAVFCAICLILNASVMLCLEAQYQGKAVHFFRLLPAAIYQVRHIIYIRNWPLFIYIILIQPLINSNLSSSLSTLVIPEFIMDVVNAKIFLYLLYLALKGIALFFFLRYLFLQQFFILKRESFKDAVKHSKGLNRRSKIKLSIKLILLSVLALILYSAIPAILLFGGDLWMTNQLRNFSYILVANRFVLNTMGYPFMKWIGATCGNILITSFLLIAFHEEEIEEGEDDRIELPEGLMKEKGWIHNLRFSRWIVIAVSIVFFLTMGLSLAILAEDEEDIRAMIDQQYEIVAHKGYSSKAPENTMSAFAKAADCKVVKYIELDVREDKNGVPVVIHNSTISDATDGKDDRSIYDISSDELKTINACYTFGDAFPKERIPTLEEVLATYAADHDFIIEIKMADNTPNLPAKIVALMEKYDCTDSSMIHSGNYQALEKVKEINPDIRCGYIITLAFGGYYDLPAADFFSMEHHMATYNATIAIHARQKKLYVWTINSEDTMRKLIYQDIDGAITDYPDKANRIINDIEDDDFMNFLVQWINITASDEMQSLEETESY